MSENGKIYLLLGPEAGEKELFMAQIKERVKEQAGGDLEESRYYPFETSMADVVNGIRNGSLFSSHKWVVIPQVESVKRDEAAILGEYCAKPSMDATMVLISSNLERDIAKAITKSIPKNQVKTFWELSENMKLNWVRSFFRQRSMMVEEDTVELILELVENNTQELRRECEKLVLFFGEGKSLSHDDVEQYLYHSKEENVFTLFDRFAAGEFSQSLEVYKKIGLSGEAQPVQLLGGLLWQFKRLLSLSLMVEDHIPFDQACRSMRIMGKKMQNVYRQALRNYNSRDLERIIALSAETDGRLRDSKTGAQVLIIEMFLYYVVEKKGRVPKSFRG